MGNQRGLFITFEGPDRVGKSTQVPYLTRAIKNLDKYQDVLETHEPWKSKEIKRKLEQDKDAYSGGEEMAGLYIDDRTGHVKQLIRPVLKTGGIVISDRYKMSTCAYQWAQGVPLSVLLDMHEDRGIILPDITFCFDAPIEEIIRRGTQRKNLANSIASSTVEKFEKNDVFAEKVLEAYRSLTHMAQVDPTIFGKVVKIDAMKTPEEISKIVLENFLPIYNSWKNGNYIPLDRRSF